MSSNRAGATSLWRRVLFDNLKQAWGVRLRARGSEWGHVFSFKLEGETRLPPNGREARFSLVYRLVPAGTALYRVSFFLGAGIEQETGLARCGFGLRVRYR